MNADDQCRKIAAYRFIEDENWQALLELGHRWRESENEKWEPHFFISVACDNLKLRETAVISSLDALSRGRTEETIWINLASIYKRLGSVKMCLCTLEEGIKACSNRTQLLLIFGKELFEKGSYSDALAYFEIASREGAGTKRRIEAFRGIVGAMNKLGKTDSLLERIDEFQNEFSKEGISSQDRLEAFRSITQTLADLRKVEALLERIDEFKKEFPDFVNEHSEICRGWHREESHLWCRACGTNYSCTSDDGEWFLESGHSLVRAPTERMWCFQCKKTVKGLVPRAFVFSRDFKKRVSELQGGLEKTPQFLAENRLLSLLFGRTENPEYTTRLDALKNVAERYSLESDASKLFEILQRNVASPICLKCGDLELRALLINPVDASINETNGECVKCEKRLFLVSHWKKSFHSEGIRISHYHHVSPEFKANILDVNGKIVARKKSFRRETEVIQCWRGFPMLYNQ
jgi:tetratricopeptide (TPR) repeat protein